MSKKLISRFSNFEKKLTELESKCDDPIDEAKQAIVLITEFLDQIQTILNSHQFSSIKVELHYFKNEYPKIYEKLHYYKLIKSLEVKKNYIFSDQQEIELLEETIKSLKLSQEHETQILTQCNLMTIEEEEKFFLRDYYKWRRAYFLPASNDSYCINSISELIGRHKATRQLIKQIEERIKQLNNPVQSKISTLRWTDNKINLILLIYGIYVSESVNNSNVELNELILSFEMIFNIDLKNFHSQLNDIKSKKGNQFKYIDALKNRLEDKLNNY